MGGVNVARLRTTPRWPLLMEMAWVLRPFGDRTVVTGFDPSTDLDELVLLNVGGEHAGELVVLRGRFDASRIAGFDPANEAGHETTYRGVRVCAPTEGNDGYLQWTASIEDMVVIGPARTVRTAIDAYLQTEPRRAWFDRGAERVRSRYALWTVGRIQDAAWHGGARLDEKPSAEAEVLTATADQAKTMAGLLQGAIFRGRVVRDNAFWRAIGDGIRVSVRENSVTLTGSIDWEPLLLMLGGRARY